MAEIHNIRDRRIIQILRHDHNQVQEVLEREWPGYYDPTESHADILQTLTQDIDKVLDGAGRQFDVENSLRREISYLKSQINALETEKNSAKSSYTDPYLYIHPDW